MQYVVGSMMVIFLLIGVFFVFYGLKDFRLRHQRRSHLVHVEGVVLSVKRKNPPRKNRTSPYQKQTWMFFPVIRFTSLSGEAITFQSEMGDNGQKSKYSPGQRLPVLYDPENQIPPMIDSWWGLWGSPVFMTLGGIVFVGGGVLIFVAFGDRIFG